MPGGRSQRQTLHGDWRIDFDVHEGRNSSSCSLCNPQSDRGRLSREAGPGELTACQQASRWLPASLLLG